ncbi:hypothetical protein NQZ68_010288 [Dissostichus eleginoides]|nr:hypothetical protein NQZ68_010288 [Dissostichus eleginoides]
MSLKYPIGLWESADVDVLPGKRCFAVESSQTEGAISWAGWAPLTPPWFSHERPHFYLIYTMFPEGLLPDVLDSTPPGRSTQIITKTLPPSGDWLYVEVERVLVLRGG